MDIGVLGAGSWGTTLALVLQENKHNVTLWSFSEEDAASMLEDGYNPRYLPGIAIPGSIKITTNLLEAARGKDLLVLATPAQYVRGVLVQIAGMDLGEPILVNVAKGIEKKSLLRMSELVHEILPGMPNSNYAVLSGPSHAEEVSHKKATTVVAAAASASTSSLVRDAFSTDYFRIYSSQDVVGVELGGSLKNVIAIGAGICDGGEYGDNTKAALITRGIAEIQRLGVAMNADPKTFAGLSGLGDLIVTTMSKHSRNRFVGEQLGKGRTLKVILSEMSMVAEGVETTVSAYELAKRLNVEMPITSQVYNILFEDKDPLHATRDLMTRQLRDES
jgi:glycerol-3-phosphate dehydrogenase (NAD(P)+)